MYSLKVENMYGEVLPLTGNPAYTVVSIGGLNPPAATINTYVLVTTDGSKFNSSRVGERNIVITLSIHPDVEKNRVNLYRFFKSKQWTKIHYQNGVRDVTIDGYVETFDVDMFENGQKAQISIICPQPYFKSRENFVTDFSSVEDLFTFEFSIDVAGIEFSRIQNDIRKTVLNTGEEDSGFIIEIHASGQVTNPAVYNADTGEFFRLNYTMNSGDVLVINTQVGEKSVKVIRDAEEINVINYMDFDSTWLPLRTGDNILTYDAQSGYANMKVKCIHTDKFGGV